MPSPHIVSTRYGYNVEPVSKVINSPCLTLDPLHGFSGAIPPVFWQPPAETLIDNAVYILDGLGKVFAQVSRCRLLYPLKITSGGNFATRYRNDGTESTVPDIVMLFDRNCELSDGSDTDENRVEVKHWKAGSLVTLSLYLRNGNYFAAQALALKSTPDAEPVIFSDLIPLMMDSSHLLQWQGRDSYGSEYTPSPTSVLFHTMRYISDHPTAVGREAFEAFSRPGFGVFGRADDFPLD